jgi:hypothetical protein
MVTIMEPAILARQEAGICPAATYSRAEVRLTGIGRAAGCPTEQRLGRADQAISGGQRARVEAWVEGVQDRIQQQGRRLRVAHRERAGRDAGGEQLADGSGQRALARSRLIPAAGLRP